MLKRFCFGAAFAALLAGQSALASGINNATYTPSPITYDFSGVLNQPVNGSTSFSGSFTLDSNTPGYFGGTYSVRDGEPLGPVALTLRLGGATYETPPALSLILFQFNAPGPLGYNGASTAGLVTSMGSVQFAQPLQGADQFVLEANPPTLSPGGGGGFAINLINNWKTGSLWPFSDLNGPKLNGPKLPILRLSDFDIAQVALNIATPNGSWETVSGYLTGLQPETITPEPGTIAIFAMLGACSLLYRHIRR